MDEYAEILEQHMGSVVSESVLGTLENLKNIQLVTRYYRFQLLKDQDDNKFVDCAVASSADFIVTHDKDFKLLRDLPFPKVNVIDSIQFEEALKES